MIDQQQIQHFRVLDLLQQSRELVPGFQQAYAFYYQPIKKQILAVKSDNNNEAILDLPSDLLSQRINKLRNQNHSIQWVEESDIPFKHLENNLQIQKEVFDEFEHYILLLRIPNTWDNANDLLYIYFKPDASNFGIRNSNNKLTTEQKSIISSLLERSFQSLHKQRDLLLSESKILRKDIGIFSEQIKSNSSKNNSDVSYYKNQLLQYSSQLLEKEAEKYGMILQLSEDTNDFLKNFKGSIIDISNSVKNAIAMAYRVQGAMTGGILHIEDYYLKAHFADGQSNTNSTIIESIAESRSSKTVKLLNRLENAARKAQAQGMNLSGSNVGQSMTNPISAPAISDALKKHRKRIQNLCNDFPNEWTLIRNSFTPLRNVIGA